MCWNWYHICQRHVNTVQCVPFQESSGGTTFEILVNEIQFWVVRHIICVFYAFSMGLHYIKGWFCHKIDLTTCELVSTCKQRQTQNEFPTTPSFSTISISHSAFSTHWLADICRSAYHCVSPHLKHFSLSSSSDCILCYCTLCCHSRY